MWTTVKAHKILGVTSDPSLTFRTLVQNLKKKLLSRNGILKVLACSTLGMEEEVMLTTFLAINHWDSIWTWVCQRLHWEFAWDVQRLPVPTICNHSCLQAISPAHQTLWPPNKKIWQTSHLLKQHYTPSCMKASSTSSCPWHPHSAGHQKKKVPASLYPSLTPIRAQPIPLEVALQH